MNKKKIIIISMIILIVLLIGLGITFFLLNRNSNNKYKYIILYNDGNIPGNNYEIYINKDYSIKLIDQPGCSTIECMEGTYYPEAETYELDFSETNKETLKTFLEDLFKEQETNKLNIDDIYLTEYQENVISSITLKNEKWFQVNAENYKYLIQYENEEYGYYIYFKENDIKVNKLEFNGDYEITNIESYNVEFSSENNILINELKDNIFSINDSMVYYVTKDEISKKELNIIEAIANNDETLINKETESKELLFSIQSTSRVNCLTGELKVYNDNTYSYVTGFTEEGEVTSVGNYTYDVNKILSNLDSSESNEHQPFTLITKDNKTYSIYDNNKYLQEFVSEIGVYLDNCVSYEG